MNIEEARSIAIDICDTWAITPTQRVWIDSLTPMDHADARAIYVKLRRNRHERDLTVGIFTDEYRQFRSRNAGQTWQVPYEPEAISLDEYLRRHPEDTHLFHRNIGAT